MEFRDGKKVSSFICVGSCDGNIKAILLQIKKTRKFDKTIQTVETDNNQNGILICKHFGSENT